MLLQIMEQIVHSVFIEMDRVSVIIGLSKKSTIFIINDAGNWIVGSMFAAFHGCEIKLITNVVGV